jgi:hypothetical protein
MLDSAVILVSENHLQKLSQKVIHPSLIFEVNMDAILNFAKNVKLGCSTCQWQL